LGRFEPEAYLVTLDQPFGPEQQPRDWPWADLAPGDFRLAQAGWRQAVITRAQAVRLGDPLNSLPDNLVVRAPDGALYLLRIRPLLPDELP
jgi:hypothetical protein